MGGSAHYTPPVPEGSHPWLPPYHSPRRTVVWDMPPTQSPLPPRYDRWMRDCLGGSVPNEPKATCHDCAMCVAAGHVASPNDPVFYNPEMKCCSYMPVLWNFLTGALLEDESPDAAAGRRSVEDRIGRGIAVTPLGLMRPPVYTTLYSHIPSAFGRALSMRCPHYIEEGGLCGVWRQRESTCATWFCKHERGAVAKQFWQRLHRLLMIAERELASWCVLQLDVGVTGLGEVFPFPLRSDGPVSGEDFDGTASPAMRQRMWGKWMGREREYYREAHRLAATLRWKQVRDIGGQELVAAEILARDAFAELSSSRIPARLRNGPVTSLLGPDGSATITTYSPVDPLRLTPEILEVLPYFDGRPVRDVCQAIESDLGVEVESDLIRKLVDFGVLEDASGGPGIA